MSAGCVVWFTGLPSSGKSTLAKRVQARLSSLGLPVAMLDGDEVRASLVPPPGYDDADRAAFYETLGRLAALLAKQGLVVLVPATAHLCAYRAAARERAPRFIEVHVATPLAECRRRDEKGLYATAATRQAMPLPGVGADYEVPAAPEVRATGGHDEVAANAVLKMLGID